METQYEEEAEINDDSNLKSILDDTLENADSSPNIFLNLQPPKTRRQKWGLLGWAVFSVLLQAGVLVFWGFATYHPAMAWKKDEDSGVPNYAYPLTAGGTLLLAGGMLICAYIVDGSTTERVWPLKKEMGKGLILWLQKGGSINDQHFDSYAIFAKGDRDGILTSRFSPYLRFGTPNNKKTPTQRQVEEIASEDHSIDSPLTEASKPINTMVIIGTAISMTGFIAQFTGLRAMHWSTSIAQLGAIMIMAIVRAWIRRDLASDPATYKVPKDNELDWLAIELALEPKDLWKNMNRSTENKQQGNGNAEDANFGGRTAISSSQKPNSKPKAGSQVYWQIVTSTDSGAENFKILQLADRNRCSLPY